MKELYFVILLLSIFLAFVSSSEFNPEAKSGAVVSDVTSEYEELISFSSLLAYIEIICQEALIRKDERIALDWISALYSLSDEMYREYAYEEIVSEDHNDEFIERGVFKLTSDILLSDTSDREIDDGYDNYFENVYDQISMVKSKMIKGYADLKLGEDYETEQDGIELDEVEIEYHDAVQNVDSKEEEEKAFHLDVKEDKPSGSESDDRFVTVRRKFETKKRRGNRGGIGRIVNTNTLNTALNIATENTANSENVSIAASNAMLSTMSGSGLGSVSDNPLDNAILMEQFQQQILSQLMGQLTANNPQLGQITSVLQVEQGRLSQVLRTNSEGIPQLNRKGILDYLRTSALPKLLNSAIKGKTGIDVLKSLSMLFRVLNEGLGVLEVILKVLISVTRTVRYYSLCAASVVADMAREDNLRPIVDLSVQLDHLPEVQAKKSSMRHVTKYFRKSLKKSGTETSDENNEDGEEGSNDPFTLGIQAALSKVRFYNDEFQMLPSKLLLAIIHTIFAELEKRNGIVRVALARKQHKTLMDLEDSVNESVEIIYKAIYMKDPETGELLSNVPSSIFTEILISLISPVEFLPSKLESHISKVTSWIKPLMVILNEDAQLNMLNYLLNDPEAERLLCKKSRSKSQGKDKDKLVKTGSWTRSRSKKF